MTRLALVFALALAGCAANPGPRDGRIKLSANPSAVIAAELGFAQLAQAKGQWTAFAETSTDDAEMFVPQRTNARAWLKGRANPPVAVKWQPGEVWMSCDGSIGVTRGPWQRPGSVGYFTTVWQRQKDGGYKWLLDQGDELAEPLALPEMIAAKVADCAPGAGPVPASPPPPGFDDKRGRSNDATLQWISSVNPAGARRLSVWLWNGKSFDPALNLEFAAPPPAAS